MSYSALAMALLCTLFFMWERLEFLHVAASAELHHRVCIVEVGVSVSRSHGNYRLVYLAGAKVKPRLALPVDLTDGKTTASKR